MDTLGIVGAIVTPIMGLILYMFKRQEKLISKLLDRVLNGQTKRIEDLEEKQAAMDARCAERHKMKRKSA